MSNSATSTARVFLFLPDPATTLLTHDQIVVEELDGEGNWVASSDPAATIEIVEDECNYYYIVVGDFDADSEFRPVLHDSNAVNADVPQTARPALDTTYEGILTVSELKNIYLFGVDLTNDDGIEFPDELYRHAIMSAIAQVETELDIAVQPTKLTETYDFWVRDYERFMFLQLANKPVISVEKVSLEFPSGTDLIEFPSEWIRVKNFGGQLEVLPSRGTFSQLLVSAAGGFLPLVFGGSDYIPDLIKVEYTAGFLPATTGFGKQSINEAQRLTHALKEVIGKKASYGPLNIAGDLVVGAGIANKSLSIDGLSQTIGTTSSATNSGYGSRLVQYDREIKQQMPMLRRYYQGMSLTAA